MIPNNKNVDEWFDALVEILPKYEINTPKRVAGFITQCAHESADFTRLEENLNYSEDALNRVFGRYFGPGKQDASKFARKPEKIANYVYMDVFRSRSGQMGNKNPGDGWMFRGRGLKQLTGRWNYEKFGETVGMTAEQAAEYVATPKGAVESACWFWDSNNLNEVADTGDVVKLTKKINGGDIGLDDRKRRWDEAMKILGVAAAAPKPQVEEQKVAPPEPTPAPPPPVEEAAIVMEPVRVGSQGPVVKRVQEALGITADGIFGPGTKAAVRQWQAANGLRADGVVGPNTYAKLFP